MNGDKLFIFCIPHSHKYKSILNARWIKSCWKSLLLLPAYLTLILFFGWFGNIIIIIASHHTQHSNLLTFPLKSRLVVLLFIIIDASFIKLILRKIFSLCAALWSLFIRSLLEITKNYCHGFFLFFFSFSLAWFQIIFCFCMNTAGWDYGRVNERLFSWSLYVLSYWLQVCFNFKRHLLLVNLYLMVENRRE